MKYISCLEDRKKEKQYLSRRDGLLRSNLSSFLCLFSLETTRRPLFTNHNPIASFLHQTFAEFVSPQYVLQELDIKTNVEFPIPRLLNVDGVCYVGEVKSLASSIAQYNAVVSPAVHNEEIGVMFNQFYPGIVIVV